MRVGSVGRHQRGVAQHAFGHVGVQVERRDQRHARPDCRTHALQQLAFGIVHALGHGSAVQVEVDRVEATGAQVFEHLGGDALEGIARDAVRRHRAGPHRGLQAPAEFSCHAGEAGQRHASAAHFFEHGRAAAIARVARARFERRPVGRRRREGVGLVVEAGDEDVHGGSLQVRFAISSSLKPAARRASTLYGGRDRGASCCRASTA